MRVHRSYQGRLHSDSCDTCPAELLYSVFFGQCHWTSATRHRQVAPLVRLLRELFLWYPMPAHQLVHAVVPTKLLLLCTRFYGGDSCTFDQAETHTVSVGLSEARLMQYAYRVMIPTPLSTNVSRGSVHTNGHEHVSRDWKTRRQKITWTISWWWN